MAARIKIAEIRKAIGACNFSRHWVSGGTAEEFRRQNVEQVLSVRIAKLQELRPHIPASKPDDLQSLEFAIEAAQETIARWHAVNQIERIRAAAFAS